METTNTTMATTTTTPSSKSANEIKNKGLRPARSLGNFAVGCSPALNTSPWVTPSRTSNVNNNDSSPSSNRRRITPTRGGHVRIRDGQRVLTDSTNARNTATIGRGAAARRARRPRKLAVLPGPDSNSSEVSYESLDQVLAAKGFSHTRIVTPDSIHHYSTKDPSTCSDNSPETDISGRDLTGDSPLQKRQSLARKPSFFQNIVNIFQSSNPLESSTLENSNNNSTSSHTNPSLARTSLSVVSHASNGLSDEPCFGDFESPASDRDSLLSSICSYNSKYSTKQMHQQSQSQISEPCQQKENQNSMRLLKSSTKVEQQRSKSEALTTALSCSVSSTTAASGSACASSATSPDRQEQKARLMPKPSCTTIEQSDIVAQTRTLHMTRSTDSLKKQYKKVNNTNNNGTTSSTPRTPRKKNSNISYTPLKQRSVTTTGTTSKQRTGIRKTSSIASLCKASREADMNRPITPPPPLPALVYSATVLSPPPSPNHERVDLFNENLDPTESVLVHEFPSPERPVNQTSNTNYKTKKFRNFFSLFNNSNLPTKGSSNNSYMDARDRLADVLQKGKPQ